MRNFEFVTARARTALLLTTTATAALALALPGTAMAQANAPDPAETTVEQDDGSANAIVVTGSRLARSTFDAPSPVTVLGGEEFDNRAVVNVGAAISELPAFRASTTPATQGFGSFNVGAQIVNLRGIGVTRSLALVNGRRFAPTTREGSVDLNLVPSVLVDRVEVVTGGASAAYGSDALAGVVNVILDTDLRGIVAELDAGISGEGDGFNLHAAAAYGAELGDAGHVVIGGEYSDQDGIGNCFTRDWCTPGAVVSNPFFATNGMPNYIHSDTNAGWFFNTGGVINRGPASLINMFGTGGITFTPDGKPAPYHPGSFSFGLSQVGGDIYPTYTDSNITVPVERYTLFGHAKFDFSDSLGAFIEGSYGHVNGVLLQTAFFNAALPIYADNPFIPAELRAAVPMPGAFSPTPPALPAFRIARVFDDIGRGLSTSTADTYRLTTGLNGDLAMDWQWDAYYQYGRTDRLQTVERNVVVGGSTPRLNYALDAVRNPATGTVTCRALLHPNPAVRASAQGCVPLNLFGEGNFDPAAADYVFGTLVEDIDLEQHVVAANIRGDLADLWAGPLAIAAGAEYRVDTIDVVHDPLSNEFAYFQNFGADYDGITKVIEGYVEAELPLVRDASWTRSLSLNGAVRYAHYDISGFGSYLRTQTDNSFGATTWKASVMWEPIDMLMLRATRSRDIRAPNFAELFLASASSFAPVVNRFNPAQETPPTIFQGGYPFLRPETGNTTTLGAVLSPNGFLDGFRVSADWYRIEVDDYIGTAPGGAQFIADRCYAGVAAACEFVDFGPNQTITRIRNVSLNLDKIDTSGIDIEAVYTLPLAQAGNSLSFRGVATYVDDLTTVNFGEAVDRAGQTGVAGSLAAPDWVANGYLTFNSPHFTTTVQGRYISPGLYDAQRIGPDDPDYAPNLPDSISDNEVEGRFYVNLFATWRAGGDTGRGFEIFGAIHNLFDRDPPAAPETQFYTNPVYFDTIGRYFRFGIRYKG
ncbi:TonB-dependent receptor [Altererythrobacter soli]|uniref:TonB-dependent receptor n=1 Tax=Croceibacterium soli TaxID=1739690 RepID=A0A6I4UVT1_9SPHN|nr:TonB-dependent receptor [Croceibacterium soli]MXP41135.1 TonB-dependent receptor [Croceibacterium soli]